MVKAGIIGSTGYAGGELARLLLQRDDIEIKWYGSRSYIGQSYASLYQNMFRIVDADWEQLCADLRDGGKDYEGDVEELFQAELYLISPLTEPERFLNKEYFLTAQQRDIERQILKKIRAERTGAYWFTGLPGTGKTLLLYDIAMKLSGKQRVCMIHCGESIRSL